MYSALYFNHKNNFDTEIMSVIFILIIASLTIAIGFLIAFLWSVKTNQYDDDYTPSVRILFDNELSATQSTNAKEKNK